MDDPRIVVVGGGAAGFFGAIAAAESAPGVSVTILEKTARFLTKVRISGGGRCNVTHVDSEPRAFAAAYPRGERALIGALHRFSATDAAAWFKARGVPLKAEDDGRMFPITDSSQTVIDCLVREARRLGIVLRTNCGVERIGVLSNGDFELSLGNGETVVGRRLLVATGGCRTPAAGRLMTPLGGGLEPPVPSLFTFHVRCPWLRTLPGVSVENVEASVAGTRLRERGPLLVTHWGLSGPVILRLSAWGARVLHGMDYRCVLRLNWLPDLDRDQVAAALQRIARAHPAKCIVNTPPAPLPRRLWEQLVQASGLSREARWSSWDRAARHRLIEQLVRTELPVTGQSLNKDEFVTCGGVRLKDVDFKTMESRACPGMYFAGEVLDVDGITGGFNFQAAWTTGWIAGRAMAESLGSG